MIHLKHLLILTLLLLRFPVVAAQQWVWSLDMAGFFDNREYRAEYQIPQTIFASRLMPEMGFTLDEGKHGLFVGGSWIRPMGATIDRSTFDFNAYYHYNSPTFKMSLGAFPRTQLLAEMPFALQYDSLSYFRPYIEGALFQYEGEKGYAELYCDWRGAQSETVRESFIVNINTEWQLQSLLLGGHMVINHLAGYKEMETYTPVSEEAIIYPYIGADLSPYTPLDSLTLRCGALLGNTRSRTNNRWISAQGFTADLLMEWRFIGIRNRFYVGDNQMPLYNDLGVLLYRGDPFYQSTLYNRTDLYLLFFRNAFVDCYGSLNMHYTPGRMDFQQQVIARIRIDSERWNNRKEKQERKGVLRNLF